MPVISVSQSLAVHYIPQFCTKGVEGVRSELEQAQFTKSLEEVRAELEQVQFSTKGLEELRAELERVRAELKEVRESGLKESVFGERKRLEDDGRCHR